MIREEPEEKEGGYNDNQDNRDQDMDLYPWEHQVDKPAHWNH